MTRHNDEAHALSARHEAHTTHDEAQRRHLRRSDDAHDEAHTGTPTRSTNAPASLEAVRVRGRLRQSAAIKASRLLVTGCVQILEAVPGHVLAEVIGDHGTYTVEHEGRWRCSCPAPTYCSHAIAISRIVRVFSHPRAAEQAGRPREKNRGGKRPPEEKP